MYEGEGTIMVIVLVLCVFFGGFIHFVFTKDLHPKVEKDPFNENCLYVDYKQNRYFLVKYDGKNKLEVEQTNKEGK